MALKNPFAPTFGASPPVLAGRFAYHATRGWLRDEAAFASVTFADGERKGTSDAHADG